jgi:hypothetical protein
VLGQHLRAHAAGRLDVRVAILGGDRELALEAELGVAQDLLDGRRSVARALRKDNLGAGGTLLDELGVDAADEKCVIVGQNDTPRARLGVVGGTRNRDWRSAMSGH